MIAGARDVFERHKASLVEKGCKQHVFTLVQAQAAAIFDAMHDKDFWEACIAPQSVLGVPFGEKDCVFIALSAFGKKAVNSQVGIAGGERHMARLTATSKTSCMCDAAALGFHVAQAMG